MSDIAFKTTGKRPEMKKMAEPLVLLEDLRCVDCQHREPSRVPNFTKQLDWEAEVGVVIGRRTRDCIRSQRHGCRRWLCYR